MVFKPLTISGFGQAFAMAMSALATSDCAGLFGTARNSMNPGTLLANGVAAAARGAPAVLEFGTTTKAGIVGEAA